MKIKISFRDPDALWYALEDQNIDPNSEYGEKIQNRISKWFEYGEYVHLVYDTEADTMEIKRT